MNNDERNFAEKGLVHRWRPAAWLRVTGEDAFTFLQGQLTNDLRNLGPEGAVYGLWLNHKGRVLGDSFVQRGGAGEFWLGSYFTSAAAIREHLEAFVVADDVAIEDRTGEWGGATLLGVGMAEVATPAGVFVFSGRRGVERSREWVFPLSLEAEVARRLAGGREAGAEEMERRRIEAGIAAVPGDIGPGELPNEGGLDEVAVSYSKGCYLGQEVMARLKNLGQVRRRLVRVRGLGEVPPRPAALYQGGRRIGELRSAVATGAGEAAGFVGLALVTLLNLHAGEPLGFLPEGGGAEVAVEEAP